MVKNIILHFDNEFFEKLKIHKLELQAKHKIPLTWELYFGLLFGQSKLKEAKK